MSKNSILHKILILEARKERTSIETNILWDAGFTVQVCHSKSEISDAFKSGEDISLLMVEVTSQNPKASLSRARSIIGKFEAPVIVISESEQTTSLEGLTELGHFGIIQRGCGETILKAVIKTAITLYASFRGAELNHERLLESEERTRKIFDSITDAVFLHPLMEEGFGNFVDVNSHACEKYGYSRDEFLNLTAKDITVPKDHMQHSKPQHRRILGERGQMTFEAVHRNKSGSPFPVEIKATVIQLHGGKMILAVVRDISSRLEVMQQLEQSEWRYRQLFEDSPVPLWEEDYAPALAVIQSIKDSGIIDFEEYLDANPDSVKDFARSFSVLNVNKASLDLFGCKSKKELKAGIDKTITTGTYEGLRAQMIAFSKGEKHFRTESEVRTFTGETVHVKMNLIMGLEQFSPASGDSTRGIVSMIDITKSKLIQQKFMETSHFLENLVDTANAIVLTLDLDFTVRIFNRFAERITGFQGSEVIGQSWLGLFISPEKISEVQNIFEQVIAQKVDVSQYENQIITRSGEKRLIQWNNSLIVETSGQVSGILSIGIDMTGQKESEQALLESEARYRMFFEKNIAVILMVDPVSGQIIFANRAALDYYGYTADELLGTSIYSINTLSPEEIKTRMAEAMGQGQSHFIFQHRLASGEIRDVEIYQSMLRFANKDVLSVIVHDITDRINAEAEKLELERQVLHTQKLESLGVLAGGLAHDINNLLTVILGNANLAILDIPAGSPQFKYLKDIENSSKRAADLANQMLAYAGKGRYILEPIDVQDLVTDMAEILSVSISKKAKVRYDFSMEDCVIKGDPSQVRQILMNLITNASEALHDAAGEIIISVSVQANDQGFQDQLLTKPHLDDESSSAKRFIHVSVEDTGCGMDEETLTRIYDPFFTTKFTGRGLGMAAVLGIVRGHSGIIDIVSHPGRGSTFNVYFPQHEPDPRDKPIRPKRSRSIGKLPKNMTILIVDDEESILTIGKRILSGEGVEVLVARDGLEALKTYQECLGTIDMVLLDLTMPNMDGHETFKALREITPGLKIILCSGYSEMEATQKFVGMGLTGFLKKPYTRNQLKRKIRSSHLSKLK